MLRVISLFSIIVIIVSHTLHYFNQMSEGSIVWNGYWAVYLLCILIYYTGDSDTNILSTPKFQTRHLVVDLGVSLLHYKVRWWLCIFVCLCKISCLLKVWILNVGLNCKDRWLYFFGLLNYNLHWLCKVVIFALSTAHTYLWLKNINIFKREKGLLIEVNPRNLFCGMINL